MMVVEYLLVIFGIRSCGRNTNLAPDPRLASTCLNLRVVGAVDDLSDFTISRNRQVTLVYWSSMLGYSS
jgi:hypothetical protein